MLNDSMERPDLIVFSRNVEQRYVLIIDNYQSHNTPSLIKKINAFLHNLNDFDNNKN
jgi:hypothetical protein